VIVVAKQSVFKTKKGEIVQFLVADETGCCYMNFFNETGRSLEEGDILYMSGAYTSYYKEMLLIYQGSMSLIRRVGRWYMKFNLANNISLRSVNAQFQEKA
jgi:ssDNA-binding replication factor A large subunit